MNVLKPVAEGGFDHLFGEPLKDQIIGEQFLCAPKAFLDGNAVGVSMELAAKLIPGPLSRLRSRWPCWQIVHVSPQKVIDSSSG
jgi:hypothetical protein